MKRHKGKDAFNRYKGLRLMTKKDRKAREAGIGIVLTPAEVMGLSNVGQKSGGEAIPTL